jgi:pimeloyl-ACP methyl ester carboxylesterase
MRSTLLTVLVLSMLVRVADAQEKGASDAKWKEAMQAYKDDYKKKSVRFKKRAIEALPAGDARTITFIIEEEKLLSSKDWWIRYTAAEQLSKVRDPELRRKLLSYAKNSDPKIREGILTALTLSNDPTLDGPVIVDALKDSSWQVRRMACWAAGQQKVKDAVEPMISMIHWVDKAGRERQKGDTHPRVQGVLLFNLEEITGQTQFADDAEQWRTYWERNKDKTLPKVKRFDVGDFGDVKGIEFNDTFARRGTGPLTIALPEQHMTTLYYLPYLSQLNFVRWLYINLPPVTSFPDVKYDDGDPIYPVDQLVTALEDMRKKYGAEKMVLMGHWFTNWVCAKYAQKYPERVQGLIFIAPYASNETFRKAIESALRSGDLDAEFWGKVSSRQIKMASQLEGEIYSYYQYSAFLSPKNRDDIELGVLDSVWHDPKATGIVIPEFDIRGEETSRIPALIYLPGKDNELMAFEDLGRLQRYYPKNVIVKGGDKFAFLPFVEQPEMFEQGLRAFVDKKVDEEPKGMAKPPK